MKGRLHEKILKLKMFKNISSFPLLQFQRKKEEKNRMYRVQRRRVGWLWFRGEK